MEANHAPFPKRDRAGWVGRSMTKKDFEAIAEVIQKHKVAKRNPAFLWDLMALFQEENPMFNMDLFLKACRHEK